MSTIVDRVLMDLELEREFGLMKHLSDNIAKKNRLLKKEIEMKKGEYVDKSIFPYLYP